MTIKIAENFWLLLKKMMVIGDLFETSCMITFFPHALEEVA